MGTRDFCKTFLLFLDKYHNLKSLFLLLSFFCIKLTAVYSQTPYWQQQVKYKIDVTLNDKEHQLDAFMQMEYYNNSPDTLHFIWMHVWPNAYKNDRTAFSDQLLENGRSDFYFSNNEKRGYINRLDFRVNGVVAKMEDHPQHQDIIKLLLPQPLLPGNKIKIQSPFLVKLPFNFSRGGHVGQSYQVTQWYPKPAVYDQKGWHAMPYLDQGEFYSEVGDYEVQVTLPKNYIVAATGELQDKDEMLDLKNKAAYIKKNKGGGYGEKSGEEDVVASSKEVKTLHYLQKNVHDFAWFADKAYWVNYDSLQLASGKTIDVFSFYHPYQYPYWKNSIQFIKNTVLTRSKWLGEYPYNTVCALEAEMGFSGGMEYPTITAISPVGSEYELEGTIEHEVGHNWNYGVLATDERQHPWMDEGMNTYYDNRYKISGNYLTRKEETKKDFFSSRIPADLTPGHFLSVTMAKKDQPVETASPDFSEVNYGLIAYYKAGQWMQLLEKTLGTEIFDSCMHEYYQRWKFKHPYPEDFRKVIEVVSGKNQDSLFSLLTKKGAIYPPAKKDYKLASFFNLNETGKHHYIFIAPLIGINFYDKLMVGGLIHNYTLPAEKFQFFLAPLYATGSKQLNGLGRLSYTWFPGNNGQNAEFSLSGATFSDDSFTDSANHTHYQRFSKIVPSLKFVFANKNARSSVTKYVQWKTFFINEQSLHFTRDTITNEDHFTFPFSNRYLNQLRFVIENTRVLYPYNAELQAEQYKHFIRLAFTGNYYFNYATKGGMEVRLFAGKLFYLGDKTFAKQDEAERFRLNMTGPNGYEDYTYSNYFVGRNEFEKVSSQQVMMRDGGFKIRTDLNGSFLEGPDLRSGKIGKTDNWLAAANFTTTIPTAINPLQVLPVKLPLKFFLDIGTYAEAWKKNATTGKIVYDAGLQLSLFADILNIYVPIFYSKIYSDYIKSSYTEKRFLKNISFSIDIQKLRLQKLAPQIYF